MHENFLITVAKIKHAMIQKSQSKNQINCVDLSQRVHNDYHAAAVGFSSCYIVSARVLNRCHCTNGIMDDCALVPLSPGEFSGVNLLMATESTSFGVFSHLLGLV